MKRRLRTLDGRELNIEYVGLRGLIRILIARVTRRG